MQPIYGKVLALFSVFVFLTSCAATRMTDSWHNPNLGGKKYQKLLVSRVAKNYGNQKIYEDVISAELMKRGIEAVPIYVMLDKGEKVANKQALEKAVAKSAADAVLSIQTTNIEKRTDVQPGYIDSYPGYWHPSAFSNWDMYGYYGGRSTYYEPPIVSTYNVATIQANMFDAASSKLIWAGTFESTEPGNAISVSKDLADDIIHALAKEGLI